MVKREKKSTHDQSSGVDSVSITLLQPTDEYKSKLDVFSTRVSVSRQYSIDGTPNQNEIEEGL